MTGLQYGGQRGGQYGGLLGGNYGPQFNERRLDLTPPGASTPRNRITAILSVTINPEHTAISAMTIEIPPIVGVNAQRYEGGTMAYHANGRLLFVAEIDDLSIADDYTISLTGSAVEDIPLESGDYSVAYEEIATADAIENFLERLPYESVVHPAPPRPLTNRLVQRASESGDFEAMLEAGNQVEDDDLDLVRDIPDAIMVSAPWDFVPTLHPTTPLQIRPEGITSTQTTVFTEGEAATDYKCYFTDDSAASGGDAAILRNKGNFVEYEFAFVHDIPEDNFNVAYRARIGDTGTDPNDRIEFSLDGQTLATRYTPRFINYSADYRWYIAQVTYDNVLESRDVAEDDDPHHLKIEKLEGDDDVIIDCVAFRDRRFGFGTSRNETVNSDGALDGPSLYPRFMPIVFDQPAVGANIDHVEWDVNVNENTDSGSVAIAAPAVDDAIVGGTISQDGEDWHIHLEYDLPDNETITTVYGVIYIDNYTDPDRKVSPLTNTKAQVYQSAEMHIDGVEHSVIDDAKEFSGTALSILQALHEYSNRRFVIEHGVEAGQKPRFDSFIKGDQSLVAGSSSEWIITSKNRDISDNGDVNLVHVVGAQAANGTYYQGIAKDEAAIEQLDAETPASDNGVRSVELRDKSLTSDNDCLSKARTELRERSRLDIGGDVETTPQLPEPGYPYRLHLFDIMDAAENVGYGLNYGQFYGEGYLGAVSSLESVSYTESAGSASTSLAFERPHALLRTIESIVETPDERPTPVRENPPVVSSADAYPHPGGDAGNEGGTGGNNGGGNGGQNAIAYLSNHPLEDAAYELGGSAGPGTHGGNHVDRPANMPTRAESDYICTNASDLRTAISDAAQGAIIYIDDDIDISGFDEVYLPTDCKLVAGYCDPDRTENDGRGPVLYNHDDAPYNRRHLAAANPVELWGVSFEGPRSQYDTLEGKYFDPRDKPGSPTDYYVSGIWLYPEPSAGQALVYGSEFRGWNVSGMEAGERTTPSDIQVTRCTFINNCMETLGYGIEQYNGDAICDLCYFDFNRHSISGYGYDTESWIVRDSMHGPNAISHAFDMHGLRQNEPSFDGNLAGKFCRMENVTIPFTEEHVRNPGSGQEGFRIRGVSEQTSTVQDCHFYHPQRPNPPGEQGDAYWQTYPGQPSNSFVNLTDSGNQFGERLEQGIGAPLNKPIKPQQ